MLQLEPMQKSVDYIEDAAHALMVEIYLIFYLLFHPPNREFSFAFNVGHATYRTFNGWLMVWLSEEAIPALFDKDALLKTQIISTDEDPQSCGSFTCSARQNMSKHGPNALTRLCKWHKVLIIMLN